MNKKMLQNRMAHLVRELLTNQRWSEPEKDIIWQYLELKNVVPMFSGLNDDETKIPSPDQTKPLPDVVAGWLAEDSECVKRRQQQLETALQRNRARLKHNGVGAGDRYSENPDDDSAK